MRWAWISGVFPVLAWAAEPTLAPPTEALPAEPQSFAVSHYELLQGYSPFVKSLEAAKETEKSPDLVVVGYGRMKGEDHVIIQQKENSEKREKIGSRYGSKDFPYRLLSVTNTSDRKTFVANLEDRSKRKLQVRYAAESSSLSPSAPPTGAAVGITSSPAVSNSTSSAAPGPGGSPPTAKSTSPSAAMDPELLQAQIQNLERAINDASKSEQARQNAKTKQNELRLQLEALQRPQELTTPEIAPPQAP